MELVSREIFWKAAGPGALTLGGSSYIRPTGVEKMCRRAVETKSDLMDAFEMGFSSDNGKTWSPLQSVKVYEQLAGGGAVRRHVRPSFVDPLNGRLLTMYNEGVFPNDDPIADGMRNNFLKYRVSLDGGHTNIVDETVIQEGFTKEKPMRGVTVGKNAVMLGDMGSETIRTRGGRLLVPVQVCPVGPDGEYTNPGGGYTYHEAAVLIGTWHDDHCKITWQLSPYICNDPARSTRGVIEPTIAQFPDGRILMVLRGSNDSKPDLPSHKWFTISQDEGETWDPVCPWTYADGAAFYSPSSMSQLLKHSNGNCYWLGNISASNPYGNNPRWPFLIGRVNPDGLLLERDDLCAVDTRGEGEWENMTLSNFHAHEDRVTGEIVLHMSRWCAHGPDDWTTDALIYRIAV